MKLMVIDGNSIVNRAYYGIRPLTTHDGLYTNAIYGFVMILRRLLDEENPDALCVAFDLHAPTFRHKEYSAYKAQRKGMPEELLQQMQPLRDVIDAMNIPRYALEGYEADDLIGTISRKCENAGWDCVVVTGDKDSLQLITEHTKVKLIATRMGQTTTKDMTPETFVEEYGFLAPHIVDLKALMGDSSDNLPGVRGIGEKTAMALIQKYETIDALYAAMPDIDAKPSAIKKLAEGESCARETYHLATILTDVPFEFSPEKNMRKPPSPELYGLFLRLEFSKFIELFGLSKSETAAEEKPSGSAVEFETVTDEKRAEEIIKMWKSAERVSVLALPELRGVGVYLDRPGESALMSEFFADSYGGDWDALLRTLFSSEVKKTSHNVKELMRSLIDAHIPAGGFVFDTALAAYLLDANAGSYDISRLFLSYYNEELTKPTYLDEDAFSMLGDRAGEEASFASYVTAVYALSDTLSEKIESGGMHALLYDIELPLCTVLADMESTGFRVDAHMLEEFGNQLGARMSECEKKIYAMAGEEFNINSPKQLGSILFEKLQIPPVKKTKNGYSTNADVLEKLRWQYPIVEEILKYRQFAKLKSTYADGLLKVIDRDGRIRTSFQMTATATGRLSSTEPNLQNIPTRTELGSEFRRMFVPEKGNVIVDADYSQIELRLLACISDDETMKNAFLSGTDIHAVTASQVFNVPLDAVTHEMRTHAKAVNFGIVYGISAFSLAQDIGVAQYMAKEYIDNYLEKYSGVRKYMEDIVAKAKADGYVETLFHRRRDLPEIKSSNFNLRSFGERVARNMPIQGTAADIMKIAMTRAWKRLRDELPEARLILQVHDELVAECPEEQAERTAKILKEEMEGAAKLDVPMTADAHWGSNWLEAKG